MAGPLSLDRSRAQLPGVLDALADMLRIAEQPSWLELVTEATKSWKERSDITSFLGLFGGMGSINDSPPRLPGGAMDPPGPVGTRAIWYDVAWDHLLTAGYFLGHAVQDAKSFPLGSAFTLPYEAWHVLLNVCPSCGTVNLRPREIEVLVASRCTWQTARTLYPLGRLEELRDFEQAAGKPVPVALRASLSSLAQRQGWGPRPIVTPQRIDRPQPGGGVSFEYPPEACPQCGRTGLKKAEARIIGPPGALETPGRSDTLWGDNGPGNLGAAVAATFGRTAEPQG